MGTHSDWSHSKFWPGQPSDVGEARRFVEGLLVAHGLPDVVEPATLVVSELASNAVQHAGTSFGVTVSRQDGSVEIAVSDGTWHTTPTFHADAFGLGGRGLVVVDNLSTDWGVRGSADGGKSVWANLDVH
jgi:anti-sigma regulatory factor (Ser/Thr protein kinase)